MSRTFFLIGIIIFLVVGFSSIFIIDETEQAVVTQFGKPVGGAITDAGIHFKTPLIQTVIKFDKRILEWDGSANEIPTLDNKYIFIVIFATQCVIKIITYLNWNPPLIITNVMLLPTYNDQ